MFLDLDKPILKNLFFFTLKCFFYNLDIPGPRRANFENFQLFGLGAVILENLDVPGPRRVNLEQFQLFGLGAVRFQNLGVPRP